MSITYENCTRGFIEADTIVPRLPTNILLSDASSYTPIHSLH